MTSLELTKTTIKRGVWQGVIRNAGAQTPKIDANLYDTKVDGVTLMPHHDEDGAWLLSVPIPLDAIAEGVQTILIFDTQHDEQIGHITLLAGDVLGDDIRAEMELLRAELDMLKRAFRRHCVETAEP